MAPDERTRDAEELADIPAEPVRPDEETDVKGGVTGGVINVYAAQPPEPVRSSVAVPPDPGKLRLQDPPDPV